MGMAYGPPRLAPARARHVAAQRRRRGRDVPRRAAYNAPGSLDGAMGTASQRLTFQPDNGRTGAADVATAHRMFDPIDVIEQWEQRLAGSVDRIDVRLQDPNGPFGSDLAALRAGRYPNAVGEIAISTVVAEDLGLAIGEEIAFDDERRTVVGLVENAGNLADEFGIVSPQPNRSPDSVTLLMNASDDDVNALNERLHTVGGAMRMARGDENPAANALLTYAMSSVALLLVALIASAAFIVVGQRRMRQLGMLAAVGGSQRQVRWVTLVGGGFVGVVAAGLGLGLGIAVWAAAKGWAESIVDHRIDGLRLPLWLLVLSAVLAIVTAARGGMVAGPRLGAPSDHTGAVGTAASASGGTSLRDRRCRPCGRRNLLPRSLRRNYGVADHRRHARYACRRLAARAACGACSWPRGDTAAGRRPSRRPRPRSTPGPFRRGACRDRARPGHSSHRHRANVHL